MSESLPYSGVAIVEVIRNAVVAQACRSKPCRSSAMVRIAVETMVWSSAARNMPSIRPDEDREDLAVGEDAAGVRRGGRRAGVPAFGRAGAGGLAHRISLGGRWGGAGVGHAGQGGGEVVEEAAEQGGEGGEVGGVPVGGDPLEVALPLAAQRLQRGVAGVGDDEPAGPAVGLVGHPAHQALLDERRRRAG